MSSHRAVTFLVANLGMGGAQRATLNMAAHWVANDWSVRIVTLDSGEPAPGYVVPMGARVISLGVQNRDDSGLLDPRNIGRIIQLRKILTNPRGGPVIAMMEKVAVVALLVLAGSRQPVIASERMDPAAFPVGMFWSGMRRIFYPLAAAVVVQTKSACRYFSGWISDPIVIPNPVPLFPRVVPPLNERPKVIAALGRLDRQKGFDILLEAFAKSELSGEGWRLIIAGEGVEREHLERQRQNLGLGSSVELPGWVDDVPGHLAGAKIYVLSSRAEGFPNALCEAMAAGCCVVATDCPSGPSDIVSDGVNGLLVDNESVEGLSAALKRLSTDLTLADRLALRAREITNDLSPENVMVRWDAVLAKCDSVASS